ncbi:substrate-binding domain-containing protein [Amycolatopsis sp. cmx-4-61]|uniref:substrate-binding domain-containing protein n=1 Tax=Amycolatopsis sp. cmx-4-61 TaxID=2790937 RepID=UPI00397DC58C
MREAVAHLVSRGHRRIGMLDGNPAPTVRRRWFLRAAAECGVSVHPGRITADAPSVDGGGGAALAALLTAHPDVTALFAVNDVMAIGALREARRFGLRVPAGLAVVGFDGLALGTLVEPELSSVAIDTRAVGALAVEQAARLVTGDAPLEPAELIVRARLHLRESA